MATLFWKNTSRHAQRMLHICQRQFKTSSSKSVDYLRKQIIRDYLRKQIIRDYLRKQIIREVKVAKFFSILADEVADVSNKEQMPLVLHFVDTKGHIREEFIKFIYLANGTTGETLRKPLSLK